MATGVGQHASQSVLQSSQCLSREAVIFQLLRIKAKQRVSINSVDDFEEEQFRGRKKERERLGLGKLVYYLKINNSSKNMSLKLSS